MNARRKLVIAMTALLAAPLARTGHELPVYPSYYPHEIEITTFEPPEAGTLLVSGQLHAYIDGSPRFEKPTPSAIGSVPSLGSFVVLRINPHSPLAGDEASACAVVDTIVRAVKTSGGDFVVHPYPVTPFHGDYLHHADLAKAATARLVDGAVALEPAGPTPKVRAEGELAQRIVRPEWQEKGADWDAVVLEVDARRLVSSATTGINGWTGPRWVRSGWFHAYRLLAPSIPPELREPVVTDAGRLETGDVTEPAERANLERALVRRLTAGCRAAVVGYSVRREYFNVGFSTGVENIAYDSLEGLSSPMFMRTVKLKDFPWNGWLKLGTATPPKAAWNPVGGFNDEFGRLVWFAVGDQAIIPSPYDHGWVLNRISEVQGTPLR